MRYISETCRDLPVAVITAFGSMDNAVTALKAGAFDYLSKPVSIDQLRALVKSVFSVTAKDDDDRRRTPPASPASRRRWSGAFADRSSPQPGAGVHLGRIGSGRSWPPG